MKFLFSSPLNHGFATITLVSFSSLIKAAIKEVITALKSSNTDKITDTTKKLNAQGEPFASKRMDRSINKALTGQSIKKLEF